MSLRDIIITENENWQDLEPRYKALKVEIEGHFEVLGLESLHTVTFIGPGVSELTPAQVVDSLNESAANTQQKSKHKQIWIKG